MQHHYLLLLCMSEFGKAQMVQIFLRLLVHPLELELQLTLFYFIIIICPLLKVVLVQLSK